MKLTWSSQRARQLFGVLHSEALRSFVMAFTMVFIFISSVTAQTISDDSLKRLTFEQKLGAQVSMGLPFRDENGNVVKLGEYFGKKPVILVLGYYGCPMLCTFVLNGMIGSLQDIPWEIGDQFEVVNVSIDPRETPALAAAKKKNYVRRYGRHDASQGWHFLTGDESSIKRLADEVGFGYAYDERVKEFAHPSGLVILTAKGTVSRYLSGVVYSTAELDAALKDAARDKVGSPIQKLFLLCFHYSPVTGKYATAVMIGVRATGIFTLLWIGKIVAGSFRHKTKTVHEAAGAPSKTG